MTKGAKIILISVIAIFVAGAIGGWTWIMQDKERARIDAEQAAEVKVVAVQEASSSEPDKSKWPTAKDLERDAARFKNELSGSSSVTGQKPLENEVPEAAGQDTGATSKPDLEPPPPPESSSEVSKAESRTTSSSSAESKSAASSSKAESSVASSKSASSSSKASSTPKPGDRKIVDGKEYGYIDGFGWVPNTGGKGTVTDGDGDINKQVGQMG